MAEALSIPTVSLTERDYEQLLRLGLYSRLLPLRDEEDWVSFAHSHKSALSTELQTALSRLHGGDPAAALLIHGVPVDDPLPPTPTSKLQARASLSALPIAKASLTTVCEALGSMVGYQQEKETGAGGLFMPVHPIRAAESAMTANSSRIDLTDHTELAFHPQRPSYLGLLCLRPDHERRAATYFATATDIRRGLSAAAREILARPVLTTGLDESWGGGRLPGLLAAFSGDAANPELTYDLDLMRSLSRDATKALVDLGQASRAARQEVVLQEGDLLLLDNRRAVHGRSPFTARYDGADRWLLRAYITADLGVSAPDRPAQGRIIATSFPREAAA